MQICLTEMDPILEYLLEFNVKHSIEYSDRYLIPVGGLKEMLADYKKFRLNRVEPLPDREPKDDLDELMRLI
jgi:hypothetical protein